MKIFKLNYKNITNIFFVIFILSTTKAVALDKFNKSVQVSNYFSGILLLNDNQYEKSFNFLKKLNGLETNHINYSVNIYKPGGQVILKERLIILKNLRTKT